jgi:hypothetical protein
VVGTTPPLTLSQRQGRALKAAQNSAHKLRMVGADHLGERQKDDFYPTPPECVRALLSVERFDGPIWEPACGDGAISRVLEEARHTVVSTDLVDRGYGTARRDFLMEHAAEAPNIITNPPFKLGEAFWCHAASLAAGKVAFLARLTWLEGRERAAMFSILPPSRVWVFSWRPKFQRARLAEGKDNGGMLAYAWYVRDAGFSGQPVLGWLR